MIIKYSETLCHSDTYLGADFNDGIKHWKYIKKEKTSNGKWRYYYKNDKLDHLNKERQDALSNYAKTVMLNKAVSGGVYNNGKILLSKSERDNFKKEKEDKAYNEYKKKTAKWTAEYISDIPRKIIASGIAFIANLFSKSIVTKEYKSNLNSVNATTKSHHTY